MRKAMLIGGIPGTGKTTLMKKIIEHWGWDKFEELKPKDLVNVLKFKQTYKGGDWPFYIVGIYSQDPTEVFQGTDRLSMAVQPKFLEFVEELPDESIVLLEGDRLFNSTTIDSLIDLGYDIEVLVLTADDVELQKRYTQRGSNQPKKFIDGRRTKVENICNRLDLMMEGKIKIMQNLNDSDMKFLTDYVLKFIAD